LPPRHLCRSARLTDSRSVCVPVTLHAHCEPRQIVHRRPCQRALSPHASRGRGCAHRRPRGGGGGHAQRAGGRSHVHALRVLACLRRAAQLCLRRCPVAAKCVGVLPQAQCRRAQVRPQRELRLVCAHRYVPAVAAALAVAARAAARAGGASRDTAGAAVAINEPVAPCVLGPLPRSNLALPRLVGHDGLALAREWQRAVLAADARPARRRRRDAILRRRMVGAGVRDAQLVHGHIGRAGRQSPPRSAAPSRVDRCACHNSHSRTPWVHTAARSTHTRHTSTISAPVAFLPLSCGPDAPHTHARMVSSSHASAVVYAPVGDRVALCVRACDACVTLVWQGQRTSRCGRTSRVLRPLCLASTRPSTSTAGTMVGDATRATRGRA
jgi:hypothetical protein